ncbi:hypothetical protein ACLB2K_008017 [Fragaria x ananassa]
MDDTYVLFGKPWHENVNGGYCKDDTYLLRKELCKIKIKSARKNIKIDHLEVFEKNDEKVTLEIKEEIALVEETLQPLIYQSETIVIQSCNILGSREEFVQVAYDKLIYGIGFMVVPFEFTEEQAYKPQVQLFNLLSSFFSTSSCFAFKMNSRSSSFIVKETDVERK